MELCTKILKQTDVVVRLSFPTATMRQHFRLDQGEGQSMDFEVTDKDGEVWIFRLYTRSEGHPKPVLTKGWLDFVKKKELRVGDKVIFFVHENGDQLGIRVQRKIMLLGQEYWGDI